MFILRRAAIRMGRRWMSSEAAGSVIAQFAASGSGASSSVAQQLSLAGRFRRDYEAQSIGERRRSLAELVERCGVDMERVNAAVAKHAEVETVDARRSALTLAGLLQPQFVRLFRAIGHLEGGVKFLTDMRADVLDLMQSQSDPTELRLLEGTLRDLLSVWFSISLMAVERVTWASPCDLLEKVAAVEAVHRVRSLADMKRRVGPNRRCFVMSHPAMPREPLVVLHVALTDHISDEIGPILRRDAAAADDSTERADRINTAIFYSISSTQRGLRGVELGNHLIKRVVQQLQHDAPHISTFSSLSPIPGFRQWLVGQLSGQGAARLVSAELCHSLRRHFELDSAEAAVERLRAELADPACLTDGGFVKAVLMHFCAAYLHNEKRRGAAINAVANFHLSNGAVLWRINWAADTSARGVEQSFGLMVNYRYYLDRVEANSQLYAAERYVTTDAQVERLLSPPNCSKSKL